jgi:hypothetical protein
MRTWLILAASLLLAACNNGPTYRETLEGKLQGKTDAEKRMILARECAVEINQGVTPEKPAKFKHYRDMQQLCEEMTGQKVNAVIPPAPKP